MCEVFEEKLERIRQAAQDLPLIVIIHNMDLCVEYMSPRGLRILGTSMEALQALGRDYSEHYFNTSDAEHYIAQIRAMIESGDDEAVVTFFQQVRRHEREPWSWYLTTTKIFCRDGSGCPTHIISTALPVDPLFHVTSKVERMLDEHERRRSESHIYALLTRREKEVIRLLVQGFSAPAIAEKLYVSASTIEQHRKNIKAKTGLKTLPELIRFAQAFDI